ncbi:uncharacterized protein LOC135835161 [Planococcus citri]|uniref:uncharacterized protein LOC135835161 n=1 Tax=Planococcus citri TaxID=170843 RepID=UPI0031F8E344
MDLRDNHIYDRSAHVPRLEDLAILTTSLELWNISYHNSKPKHNNFRKKPSDIVINELGDNIPLPVRIKKRIKTLCFQITREIDDFHAHNFCVEELCNCLEVESTCFYPHGVVWEPNGYINGKKTALKALFCSKRKQDYDLMFEVMARFCLKDCLADFPISLLDKKYIQMIERGRSSDLEKVQHYWLRYVRGQIVEGQMDPRNLPFPSNFVPHQPDLPYMPYWVTHLVRLRVHEPSFKCDGAVVLYFWNYLSDIQKINLTRNLIRYDRYRRYQMVLFSKLSGDQLRQVYEKDPVNIILNFISLQEFELANAAFEYYTSTILNTIHYEFNKFHDFDGLIKSILIFGMKTDGDSNFIHWLISVWESVPKELIAYMMSHRSSTINAIYFDPDNKPSVNQDSLEFLKAFLSRASTKYKSKFFQERGEYLICNYDTNICKVLMEHCLKSVKSRRENKEKLLLKAIKSKENGPLINRFRDTLFSSHKEFLNFLKFFTKKSDLKMQLQLRLSQPGILVSEKLLDTITWNNVSMWVDEVYANNAEEARLQKKEILFSLDLLDSGLTLCSFDGSEYVSKIDNLTKQVLTEVEIIIFKEKIASSFLHAAFYAQHGETFMKINFDKLISWCKCGDENKISQFKSSFPIVNAFHLVMSTIIQRYVTRKDAELSFSSLDELLHWYLQTPNEIQEFKVCQLYDIMRANTPFGYSGGNYRADVVDQIMRWFFCGDLLNMRNFECYYEAVCNVRYKIYWYYTNIC